MVDSVIFSKRALNELDKIFDYYESCEIGLGTRFFSSVDKKIIQISNFPNSGVVKKNNYRETYLNTFPLANIYKYDKVKIQIIITSVFHFKRNPLKKY
jgi:plasmid stabilization system protein ParE